MTLCVITVGTVTSPTLDQKELWQDQCPLGPEVNVRGLLLGHLAQRRRPRGVLFTGLDRRNRKKEVLPKYQGIGCFVPTLKLCLFATPWTAARRAPLPSTFSRSLLRFMSTESVMPSNHLTFSCPFLLSPSILPSIRVFSNESALFKNAMNHCL